MKKSILIIGNQNSIWVKDFINNVLLPECFQISLMIDPTTDNIFKSFYVSNGINLIGYYHTPKILHFIPKVKIKYKEMRTLFALQKEQQKFDYVFVISTTVFFAKCAKRIYTENTRVFVIFIGSDILRLPQKNVAILKQLLLDTKAEIVPVCQKNKEACERILFNNTRTIDHVIDFGSSQLEIIDWYLRKGKEYSKSKLGINPEKITICVGHNGFASQQHIRILNNLMELPNSIKKRVALILPMTYGAKEDYIEEVKVAAKAFDSIIFDKFLDQEELAIIRVASDVYINAQVTDALSTSMLEHIYSGSLVLAGNWLEYPELHEMGIQIVYFSSFNELKDIVCDYSKYADNSSNQDVKREIIREYASWEACHQKWKKLIELKG